VRDVALPFEEAIARTEAALKTEARGACQIDIQAKLKESWESTSHASILGAATRRSPTRLSAEINVGCCCLATSSYTNRTERSGGRGGCLEAVVRGGNRHGRNALQVNEKLRRVVDSVTA